MARGMRWPVVMNGSIVLSVVLLVGSLFVGNALKAHAMNRPAVAAVQAGDTAASAGYWAVWADAASR